MDIDARLPVDAQLSPLRTTDMSPAEALELEHQAISILLTVDAAGLLRPELADALRKLEH